MFTTYLEHKTALKSTNKVMFQIDKEWIKKKKK